MVVMETKVPKDFIELFKCKAIGILATIQEDNSPHTSVVWIDYDEPFILFNSITSRQKYKNIRKNPNVSLLVIDPNDIYRYIEIRGKIEEITTKNAITFVNKLAKKYLGVETYPYHRSGVTRVIYKLKPFSIFCYRNDSKIN